MNAVAAISEIQKGGRLTGSPAMNRDGMRHRTLARDTSDPTSVHRNSGARSAVERRLEIT
jgi:hypothetical protein